MGKMRLSFIVSDLLYWWPLDCIMNGVILTNIIKWQSDRGKCSNYCISVLPDLIYHSLNSTSKTIRIYSGTCLILHINRSWKRDRLYRMSEYSGFILAKRNNFGL